MRNTLFAVSLLVFFIPTSQAQKWSFEGVFGGRLDNNEVSVLSGKIVETEAAYPVLQANLNYHLSSKWFISSGLQMHDFSIRTVVATTDYNAMMQKNIVLGVPVGINYVINPKQKLNIEIGTGTLSLFPSVRKSITMNNNTFPDSGQTPRVGFSKSEISTFPNRLTFIPYIRIGLNFYLLPLISAFGNFQYNFGTKTVLERTINYTAGADVGKAIFVTDGTGTQSNFGIRYYLKEKKQ